VTGGAVTATVIGVTTAPPPAGSRRLDPDRLGDHVDRLFRAAWAICGDRHDAEDLVQETFARVLARPRWLRRDGDLGYLLRVLRNTHVSRLRHAGRRPSEVAFDDDRLVEAGGRHDGLDGALDAHALFAAIAQLPEWARETIVMVDVAGLSYGEAAAVLHVKEATVATRLHRARRRVAGALDETPIPIEAR
jgi:RNA polymerase sigma-70 factor, ECF subfamily